jgi:DHA1 family bicyclomycin/chloramphenicol resistance-like MFS transporter
MPRPSGAAAAAPRHLATLVALTSVCGFVATDIFLPAIPALSLAYERDATRIQALFSVFLYTLAVGQLLLGPLSDAIGRRIPLLASLAAYSIASLAIPCTTQYGFVLAWRAVQAAGACGAIVVGRAVAADFYRGDSLRQFFLGVSILVGMSPALAPVLGQQLYAALGWQSCFLFTAGFGAVLGLLVYGTLPESRERAPASGAWMGAAARAYGAVLSAPDFRLNVAVIAVSQAAYFAYLSESAFLLLEQGMPAGALGYAYISLSVAYVAGNIAARGLATRWGAGGLYRCGCVVFLCAAVLLGAGLTLLPGSTAILLGGISALTFANGFLLPLGTAAVVGAVPAHSACASGLAGFIQLLCAAMATQAIGPLTGHQPAAFGQVMLGFGLANLALYLALRNRLP